MKTYQVVHRATCRQRIFEKLVDERSARTERFIERMSAAMEKIEKIAEQKQTEANVRSGGGGASGSQAGQDASMQAEEKETADAEGSGSVDLEKENLYGQSDLEYEPSAGEDEQEALDEQPQAQSEARRFETERMAAKTRKAGGAVPAEMWMPAKRATSGKTRKDIGRRNARLIPQLKTFGLPKQVLLLQPPCRCSTRKGRRLTQLRSPLSYRQMCPWDLVRWTIW